MRLAPVEVAVIEVLRDPDAVEASDAELRRRIAELVERGAVRLGLLGDESAGERHLGRGDDGTSWASTPPTQLLSCDASCVDQLL